MMKVLPCFIRLLDALWGRARISRRVHGQYHRKGRCLRPAYMARNEQHDAYRLILLPAVDERFSLFQGVPIAKRGSC